jgi:hypothetical protein
MIHLLPWLAGLIGTVYLALVLWPIVARRLGLDRDAHVKRSTADILARRRAPDLSPVVLDADLRFVGAAPSDRGVIGLLVNQGASVTELAIEAGSGSIEPADLLPTGATARVDVRPGAEGRFVLAYTAPSGARVRCRFVCHADGALRIEPDDSSAGWSG